MGFSGGILIIWNKNSIEVEDTVRGKHSISVKCKFLLDGFSCTMTGVYAPCDVLLRKNLWSELNSINDRWELPWCIGGHFNEILRLGEREGRTRSTRGMKHFYRFVNDNELTDLYMTGARYSWKDKSLLDRFLVSAEFDMHFPTLAAQVMGKPFSDHAPIRFNCDIQDWGPCPLRFQAMWLHNTDLLERMKVWWELFSFHGSAGFVLAKKLQALKAEIKVWNKDVFGRIDRQMEEILVELADLDSLHANHTITVEQAAKKDRLKHNFEEMTDRKHIMWLQKAGHQWHKDGDRNTVYFHRKAKLQRRRANIHSLRINGQLTEDKQLIKSSVTDFFSNLF